MAAMFVSQVMNLIMELPFTSIIQVILPSKSLYVTNTVPN